MDGFALAFDVCVEDLFNHWNYLKYGFEYDNDAHVNNIQQADDLYIISSSWMQHTTMLTQFEDKIAEIGLDLSETKLQWATNVEQAKERILTCKAGSFKATDKIDCLGTVVAINTMMFAEVDKGIATGWAQYFPQDLA